MKNNVNFTKFLFDNQNNEGSLKNTTTLHYFIFFFQQKVTSNMMGRGINVMK